MKAQTIVLQNAEMIINVRVTEDGAAVNAHGDSRLDIFRAHPEAVLFFETEKRIAIYFLKIFHIIY